MTVSHRAQLERNTLVMIMAGGKGSRLEPLTCHRAKPAVPFGGRYRIIDFVLSNFVNSGYRSIYVLSQYMASSLIKHLNRTWRTSGFGEFIEVVPAQMRMGEFWYRGTADAVYQNLNLVRDSRADTVAVFGGDHVYKLAVDQMEDWHRSKGADLTVAAFPVPTSEASAFGVIDVDAEGRIIGFLEKPKDPPEMPGKPGMSLVSMGNYIFDTATLVPALLNDADDAGSSHDFGKDIIPRLLAEGRDVFIYDFADNRIPGDPAGAVPYWRDVGTIDSYVQANMDLRSRVPMLNSYNRSWRLHTAQRDYPPARFVRSGPGGKAVEITDTLVCEGSIVQSATLTDSLVGYDCFVHDEALVSESVVLSGCDVGAGAVMHRVVADKNCKLAPGARVGLDAAADRERFPFVSEAGYVVLPKGTFVPAEGPIVLAHDIVDLLTHDPHTAELMRGFAERYDVSATDRHSFLSAGPRYEEHVAPPRAGAESDD